MKRKIMATLLATALSVSAFAGCGSEKPVVSSETSNQAESVVESQQTEPSEEVKEPSKLTIWVPENLRIQDWKENAQTKWLEENGNLDLEFVVMSSADYETKVSVALTVGDIDDLPDVIIGSFNNNKVWEFAQAETILPLTDYYNDPALSPNIHKAYEATGTKYTDMIVSPDGNIYGVATFNQSYGNEYPHKLWIYKPWLDALGEDLPTTTEELYDLFKKVKETDLNGNGKADEIPMLGNTNRYAGYFQYLMNAFTYAGEGASLMVEDGKISAACVTEEWKKGLEYVEKLFDEGFILTESLTMDDEQAEVLNNGELPTVFSLVRTSASKSIYKDDFVGCDALTGPDGVSYASFSPSKPTVKMLVTANCEDPDAAFRLGDLLSSEEMSITSRYGQRGVHWDYAEDVKNASDYVAAQEGYDLSIILHDNDAFWGSQEVQTSSWLQTGPLVLSYGISNGRGVNASDIDKFNAEVNACNYMYQNSGKRPDEVIANLIFTTEETEVRADLDTAIKNYKNEFWAGVCSGNIDLEAEWDNYVAELNKIGLDTYLEITQTVYDRMYK